MEVKDIMVRLSELGSEQTKTVLTRHGAKEPFYGVKIADLKKVVSQVKKAHKSAGKEKLHQLGLELYRTGNSDAMYMAAFLVEPEKMTAELLQEWVEGAYWYMISDYTVAWTAAASPAGWNIAHEWMNSRNQFIASAGWSTISSILSVTPDEDIDKKAIIRLLERAEKEVHNAKNRVRYSINNFVIAAGSFVPDLTAKSKEIGGSIGIVTVDMGGTSCKVPEIVSYIEKVESKGKIGHKKKTTVC